MSTTIEQLSVELIEVAKERNKTEIVRQCDTKITAIFLCPYVEHCLLRLANRNIVKTLEHCIHFMRKRSNCLYTILNCKVKVRSSDKALTVLSHITNSIVLPCERMSTTCTKVCKSKLQTRIDSSIKLIYSFLKILLCLIKI